MPQERRRHAKPAAAAGKDVPDAPDAPPPAPVQAPNPLESAIRRRFVDDQTVRDVVTTHLTGRSADASAVAQRAHDAFASFTASRYSAEVRDSPAYLGPHDDLETAHENVINAGVDAERDSGVRHSIVIRDEPGIRAIAGAAGDGPQAAPTSIEYGAFIDYMAARPAALTLPTTAPALNVCKAEVEAERRASQIEAPPPAPDAARRQVAGNGAGKLAADAGAAPDDPAAPMVHDNITLQMGLATPPEGELRFAVASRADQDVVKQGVTSFELRAGASDVTAYHDFSTLQIAFQSVWTEVFHGELSALGRELYEEYVKLKEFAGADDGDRQINTVDDLRSLMEEVRNLSSRTQDSLPFAGEASGPSAGTSMSAGSGRDVVSQAIHDTGQAIDDLGKAITGPAQWIAWNSFPGPLPGPFKDMITVEFQPGAAVPGTVEIELTDSHQQRSPWKGVAFREFDAAGHELNQLKITNDWTDTDVWNTQYWHTLILSTGRVKNGVLEFDEEWILQRHFPFYLLGGLEEKLTDQMRVTFTW